LKFANNAAPTELNEIRLHVHFYHTYRYYVPVLTTEWR